MHVERLELIDFRNHPAVVVGFSPGPSLLVGSNGVGKTNLLEALGYLATLASHRPGSESSLVRVGAPAAVVRAAVARDGRTVLVDLEIRPGSGLKGRVNRAPVPRARDVVGIVRATLFAPEDLAMVRGDPEERRRFLDTLAVQRLPRYLAIRQDYERILRQRNTLLRSAGGRLPPGAGLATLDVWDEKLAAAGAELWSERLRLVEAVRPLVERAYQDVAAQADPVEMIYVSSVLRNQEVSEDPPTLARAMRERLLADRSREVERGITLSGPHRDDLALSLRDLPARTHASHGEAWSLALALRLGAHELLSNEGEEPILLLDDVFAELDRRRRERLADLAVSVEQAIITASVADELPVQLKATMFHVEPGNVSRGAGP
jgi:DNA replication and repair protein RecF